MNITKYEVISLDGLGLLKEKNGYTISEVEVIGENDRRIVLKDEMFTRLEKKKSSCFESIGEPSIRIIANDNCWGSGVMYTLYTFKKKKVDTIKKEIERKILDKCGYFMRGVDLSMLNQPDTKEVG